MMTFWPLDTLTSKKPVKVMKKEFKSQLEAIDWIAENAKNETHFEILREELNFNRIYTQELFINLSMVNIEVALLDLR